MNFKIDENKLEKVIFRYLDNKKFIIKETETNFYFREHKDSLYATINVSKEREICFIYPEFITEISSFFSINIPYSKYYIVKYTENLLGIKIKEVR